MTTRSDARETVGVDRRHFLLLLPFLLACAGSDHQNGGDRSPEAGPPPIQSADGGPAKGARIALSLVREGGASPQSRFNSIAFMPPHRFCGIDSYARTPYCKDVESAGPLTEIGREGEGPGEFRAPTQVLRDELGRLVVVDNPNRRVSIWSENGVLEHERRAPPGLVVLGASTQGYVGVFLSPSTVANGVTIGWFADEAEPDSVVVLQAPSDRAADMRPGMPVRAIAQSPSGEFYVWAANGQYELLRFASDGTYLERLRNDEFVPEPLGPKDVQSHIDDFRSQFGQMPPESFVTKLEGMTRQPFLSPWAFDFDKEERLWVATTVDRDQWSYFDVFSDGRLVHTARIAGRLLAFDVIGDRVLVLVERPAIGDAIPERGVDEYRIYSP